MSVVNVKQASVLLLEGASAEHRAAALSRSSSLYDIVMVNGEVVKNSYGYTVRSVQQAPWKADREKIREVLKTTLVTSNLGVNTVFSHKQITAILDTLEDVGVVAKDTGTPRPDFTEPLKLDEEVEETFVNNAETRIYNPTEAPSVTVGSDGQITIEDDPQDRAVVIDREQAEVLIDRLTWAISGVDELDRLNLP